MTIFNKTFWRDAVERSVKTVAQTMVAVLSAGATGLMDINWASLLSVSGLAGLVSILTSIASASATQTDSASLVNKEVK